MAFIRRSTGGESLLDAFRSGEGVEEPDSLKSRAFLIILRKASISSLCLVCADVIAAAMAEVTILKIEYCIAGSIAGEDMAEVSSWNSNTASE